MMPRRSCALRTSTLQRVAGLAVCAGVAVSVLPLACLSNSSAARSFVASGVGASTKGAHRGALSLDVLTGGSLVAPAAPSASPVEPSSVLRSVAGVAALLFFAAARRAPSAAPASKVVMQARSPFPSEPTAVQNDRSVAVGGKAFYGKRQIMVRVNKKTNKPIHWRMHVKPGDVVQVCKGKDKGKVTTVLRTFPDWNRVLCLGVNYCIKHVRPTREDEVGQRVQVEAPMQANNLMHYDEEKGVAGRLGYRYVEIDGKVVKQRYNKATGETIEKKEAPKWVPVLERE